MIKLIGVICLLQYAKSSILEDTNIQNIIRLSHQLEKEKTPFVPKELTKVTLDDVSFYVYTKSDQNGTKVSFQNASVLTDVSSFDTSLKTVIYLHGWIDDHNGEGCQLIKAGLFNITDVNFLSLDWDECGNSINYIESYGCVKVIGEYIGQFLATINATYSYPVNNVTIVGHSLGAHMAGYAGKYLNSSLGTIVGLDPAAPLFLKAFRDSRLNEGDAQYVQAIHTCSRFLGVSYQIAEADFWPNGGASQNGCGLDIFGQCAHIRSYKYYAESLTSDDFVARKCDSYKHFEKGTCSDGETGVMGGWSVDRTLSGNFYFDTNEDSPFGKGE